MLENPIQHSPGAQRILMGPVCLTKMTRKPKFGENDSSVKSPKGA